MKEQLVLLLLLFLLFGCTQKQSENVSKKDVEIAEKVKTLMGKMTLEEKIAEMTQNAPANKRLGIPEMKFAEGLHGIWKNGRPLSINYIAENIPSILETWYLGMR